MQTALWLSKLHFKTIYEFFKFSTECMCNILERKKSQNEQNCKYEGLQSAPLPPSQSLLKLFI
jgi:hypothetical protein